MLRASCFIFLFYDFVMLDYVYTPFILYSQYNLYVNMS